MRKSMILPIFLAFSFLALSSCAKKTTPIYSSARDQFQLAMNFYQKGRYEKAIESFRNVIYRFPMSSYAAEAQYYIAMSYMKDRDYTSAIEEFRFLIENYPSSKHLEEAVYRIAEAYYLKSLPPDRDQSDTRNAMLLANEFLNKYPSSQFADSAKVIIRKCRNKLARKMLIAVDTFIKLEKYNSALIYLELFKKEYGDTDEKWLAKYYEALVYAKTDQKEKADEILRSLLQNPDVPSRVKAKAGSLYWKISA